MFGLYAVLSGYVFKRMAMHAAVRSSALLQICVSVHSCFHKRIAMRVASVGGDAEQGQFLQRAVCCDAYRVTVTKSFTCNVAGVSFASLSVELSGNF